MYIFWNIKVKLFSKFLILKKSRIWHSAKLCPLGQMGEVSSHQENTKISKSEGVIRDVTMPYRFPSPRQYLHSSINSHWSRRSVNAHLHNFYLLKNLVNKVWVVFLSDLILMSSDQKKAVEFCTKFLSEFIAENLKAATPGMSCMIFYLVKRSWKWRFFPLLTSETHRYLP